MQTLQAVIVYLIVVIVVYLLLAWGARMLNAGAKLFFALFVGALVSFLLLPGLVTAPLTASDGTGLSLFLLIVYLAPLIVGAWLVFRGVWVDAAYRGKLCRSFVTSSSSSSSSSSDESMIDVICARRASNLGRVAVGGAM